VRPSVLVTLTLALIVALALPRRAAAEIAVADSIEWMTADAALVVRGPVVAVAAHEGPGAVVWYDITVSVNETLKGKAGRRVTFAVRDLSTATADAWRATREDRLWFLVGSARRVADDPGYRRAPYALRRGDGATLRLDGSDRAYTARFTVLSTRDALLAAVRTAATSPATASQRVDAPYDSAAFQALYGGSSVWIIVPVDATLERQAIGWIDASDGWTRVQGVESLAHFPSKANQARITRLLADPEFATVTETGKPTLRRYLVRAAAHTVLVAWRVPHPPPVIDEPSPPSP